MSDYLELARFPGVARITASQLVARLPFGMLALAVLVHVRAATGSYGTAGAVDAAFSVGEAVAGPVSGRLVGAVGTRPVVLASSTVCATAVFVLALAPCTTWEYLVAGLVGGLAVPPVMPAVRSIYPRLVPVEHLPVLFALDASSQEIIWTVGPVAVAALAAGVSTGAPLIAAAVLLLGGGSWFLTSREVALVRIPRPAARFGAVLAVGAVPASAVISALLVSSYTALEVAVVAREAGSTVIAGVAIAISSLGSLIGGALLGPRTKTRTGLVSALVAVLVFTVLSALAPDLPVFLLGMFASGLGFAPALSYLYHAVSDTVADHESAEAFGWLGTGGLAGGALGTAVAGVVTDKDGWPGAFAVAMLLAAGTCAAPLFMRVTNGPRQSDSSTGGAAGQPPVAM